MDQFKILILQEEVDFLGKLQQGDDWKIGMGSCEGKWGPVVTFFGLWQWQCPWVLT